MNETKFKKLVGQISALAPLCDFQVAESLCDDEVLFYRKQYNRLNSELNNLVGGIG